MPLAGGRNCSLAYRGVTVMESTLDFVTLSDLENSGLVFLCCHQSL